MPVVILLCALGWWLKKGYTGYQKTKDEVGNASPGNIWSTETLRREECPGRK